MFAVYNRYMEKLLVVDISYGGDAEPTMGSNKWHVCQVVGFSEFGWSEFVSGSGGACGAGAGACDLWQVHVFLS